MRKLLATAAFAALMGTAFVVGPASAHRVPACDNGNPVVQLMNKHCSEHHDDGENGNGGNGGNNGGNRQRQEQNQQQSQEQSQCFIVLGVLQPAEC